MNISTQGCKLTEPGMMNIYWTKIKLCTAANQAIYLVIFHRVVGQPSNLSSDFPQGSRNFKYLNILINY